MDIKDKEAWKKEKNKKLVFNFIHNLFSDQLFDIDKIIINLMERCTYCNSFVVFGFDDEN